MEEWEDAEANNHFQHEDDECQEGDEFGEEESENEDYQQYQLDDVTAGLLENELAEHRCGPTEDAPHVCPHCKRKHATREVLPFRVDVVCPTCMTRMSYFMPRASAHHALTLVPTSDWDHDTFARIEQGSLPLPPLCAWGCNLSMAASLSPQQDSALLHSVDLLQQLLQSGAPLPKPMTRRAMHRNSKTVARAAACVPGATLCPQKPLGSELFNTIALTPVKPAGGERSRPSTPVAQVTDELQACTLRDEPRADEREASLTDVASEQVAEGASAPSKRRRRRNKTST